MKMKHIGKALVLLGVLTWGAAVMAQYAFDIISSSSDKTWHSIRVDPTVKCDTNNIGRGKIAHCNVYPINNKTSGTLAIIDNMAGIDGYLIPDNPVKGQPQHLVLYGTRGVTINNNASPPTATLSNIPKVTIVVKEEGLRTFSGMGCSPYELSGSGRVTCSFVNGETIRIGGSKSCSLLMGQDTITAQNCHFQVEIVGMTVILYD